MKNDITLLLLVSLSLTTCDYNDITASTEIKGRWEWKSTCGGIIGCVYASASNERTLIIGQKKLAIEQNGGSEFDTNYTIVKKIYLDDSASYELTIDNGSVWKAIIKNNYLIIEDGIASSEYQRLD